MTDNREINQHYFDNERGTVGSDFSVNACAADALTVLSSVDVAAIHTNHYESYLASEAWSPRRLFVVNGCLVLTDEKVLGDSTKASSLLREDRDLCKYCSCELPWNWTPRCPGCGRELAIKTVRIPPGSAVA